jgi:hypothetical protein
MTIDSCAMSVTISGHLLYIRLVVRVSTCQSWVGRVARRHHLEDTSVIGVCYDSTSWYLRFISLADDLHPQLP